MPIRWSAVSVSESMDNVEKEIEDIFEPLWRAHKIVRETMLLPNLPKYMKIYLAGVMFEIHNITGDNIQRHGSRILNRISMVRNNIPEGEIEAEKEATRHGKKYNLFA